MGTLYRIHSGSKKKGFLGFSFAEQHIAHYVDVSLESKKAEEYVAHATANTHTISAIPVNLPIAQPTIGYDALSDTTHDTLEHDVEVALTALENQAHRHKVLLSSDAMRYFISKVKSQTERTLILDTVLKKARVSFPSEEGWVVLNLQRMEELLDAVGVGSKIHDAPTSDLESSKGFIPMTAGSLAEAIVTKNEQAAYLMIANRPMVALADAASDLNAVYRERSGEKVTISNLLKEHTSNLSNGTLEEVISALTTAIDGTDSNEESAVKTAIAKAIMVLG